MNQDISLFTKVKPYNESDNKTEQLISLFDSISGEYDHFNQFSSLGLAKQWRRISVQLLNGFDSEKILDIACGTADMCLLMADKLNPAEIIGVDVSSEMLRVGRKKVNEKGLSRLIQLHTGDSSALNFPAESFDIVTVAFGIRNFEKLTDSVQEMNRVLKPGGVMLIIEVNEPKSKMMKLLYKIYMNFIITLTVFLFNQDRKSYKYLANSMAAFPSREKLVNILEKFQFKLLKIRNFSFEVCTAYLMQKVKHQ
jgi:demethylmenaquinone methyltransferase/2-methoxy-6-polyprenyl-1,4-benzoquinol methylase